jgi:hypothetical protein
MNAEQIMRRVKEIEYLGAGQAMYYSPANDSVKIGRDGCQPSNTICLRVGPDHISDYDLHIMQSDINDQINAD